MLWGIIGAILIIVVASILIGLIFGIDIIELIIEIFCAFLEAL